MSTLQVAGEQPANENLVQFFEQSLCGFLIADPGGIIIKSNAKLSAWTGISAAELKGKKISDLFAIGSKIYYETHLLPLLRMQSFFAEVLVELNSADGQKLRVLINASEYRDKNDKPELIHFSLFMANDRLQYEQNLQQAKTLAEKELLAQKESLVLREQLIAVLGHDLRNPLSASIMAVQLLEYSQLNPENRLLLATLKRSNYRMSEIIANIMDFARTRLGEGIIAKRRNVVIQPVLQHVVDELKLIFPQRKVITSFDIEDPVSCDPDRIAQLMSNLLANALTHGAADMPVVIHALHKNGAFTLSVTNNGVPIPAGLHKRLFTPFAREGERQSQNGLGLGLYISAEIARAHGATLTCDSDVNETTFTFIMNS